MSAVSALGAFGYRSGGLWGKAYNYMNLSAAKAAASHQAQPDVPVEPVEPVRAVRPAAEVGRAVQLRTTLPAPEELNNAADHLARMGIQYGDAEPVYRMGPQGLVMNSQAAEAPALALPGAAPEGETPALTGTGGLDAAQKTECQTCARRKYQDGSDDPGVSFKTPTKISPEEAPAKVMGHEREHVVRERAEAAREGREVVSQSVSIHTDICPECGRVYVSGGVTRTVTAEDNSDQLREQKKRDQAGGLTLDQALAA